MNAAMEDIIDAVQITISRHKAIRDDSKSLGYTCDACLDADIPAQGTAGHSRHIALALARAGLLFPGHMSTEWGVKAPHEESVIPMRSRGEADIAVAASPVLKAVKRPVGEWEADD